MKQSNLVWSLLRKNISVGQLVGYALANFVGLSIVLVALQFYIDSRTSDAGEKDPFISNDYLVLSKKMSGVGSLLGADNSFSEEDIAELKNQPWVEEIGLFTPSFYHVSADINMGGRGMSSYMFFESIPDEFFDVLPKGWSFDPNEENPVIPIIISKDYLALYNFGFAASRGLPQISEELITKVPLEISISGNGRQRTLPGRVVGFSSRLNTIAVPGAFMDWANDLYGERKNDNNVSRIIVRTDNPGNPAIERYLADHKIEVPDEKLSAGRAAYFISIVSIVVMIVGVAISLLSFFILMLSIFLLLLKNRDKLRDLMLLGYSPAQVGKPYVSLIIILNGAIWILSSAVLLGGASVWQPMLKGVGLSCASPLFSVAGGLIIMCLSSTFNILAIKRIIKRNF